MTEPAPQVTQETQDLPARPRPAAMISGWLAVVFAAVACVLDGGELRAALARAPRTASR